MFQEHSVLKCFRAGVARVIAGNLFLAAMGLQVGASPAAADGPKAYIGLFKDNSVAVLDAGLRRVVNRIPIPAGPHGLVSTPDGRWIYASSDGDSKVSVIDTQSDQVAQSIEVGKSPHGLAITPDGKTVLVAVFGAGKVAFIDAATNRVMGDVAVPNPHNIAVSPDGKSAYVAAQAPGKTALAILDLTKRKVTTEIPLAKTPRALNFSPDGRRLYFTLAGVDAVQVLDPATKQVVSQIAVGASPHHVLFTPDGTAALVVAQGPGELDVIDPGTGAVQRTAKVGTMPHWISLMPDGKTAWVTNEGSNDVSVVDLSTGSVTSTIAVGNGPRKIVFQGSSPEKADLGATVRIRGFALNPQSISIRAGQEVTWKNEDAVTHSATDDNGVWNSGDLPPGRSYRTTFNTAGTYTYHCAFHPYMTGTITVAP